MLQQFAAHHGFTDSLAAIPQMANQLLQLDEVPTLNLSHLVMQNNGGRRGRGGNSTRFNSTMRKFCMEARKNQTNDADDDVYDTPEQKDMCKRMRGKKYHDDPDMYVEYLGKLYLKMLPSTAVIGPFEYLTFPFKMIQFFLTPDDAGPGFGFDKKQQKKGNFGKKGASKRRNGGDTGGLEEAWM